jgi:hypothetical protein
MVKWVAGATVALSIGFGGAANADPVYMSNWGQVPSGIGVTIAGSVPPGGNGTFSAGQFQLTVNPGNTFNSPSSVVLDAWCVDIFQTITAPKVYDAVPFSSSFVGGDPGAPPASFTAVQISQVTGLALAGNAAVDGNNNNNAAANSLFGSNTDQVVSAAVQGAIWAILYPTKSVTSGNAATQALMTSLLTNRAGFSGSGGTLLRSNSGQDQLVFLPGGPGGDPQSIPAPAGLLILGFGLLGLAAARRAA